jgi:hypothetical protein
VVGKATNGREAVEKAIKLKANVAVVDTSMPELEGQAKSVLTNASAILYVLEASATFRDALQHSVQFLRPDWLAEIAVHARRHASFLVALDVPLAQSPSDVRRRVQSSLARVAFRLNQRSRATLAVETPASRLRTGVASTH